MKITTKISGTSRTEIRERAEAARRQLLDGDDLTQCVISYGEGSAETVDTRPGGRQRVSDPRPEDLQVVFTVEVTVEVPAP